MIQLLGLLGLLTVFGGAAATAADVVPPRSDARPGDQTAPPTVPAPDPPPSNIDPGMVKVPETVPAPKSAVPPPKIDQEMVIDPEERTPDGTAPKSPKDGPKSAPKAPPKR